MASRAVSARRRRARSGAAPDQAPARKCAPELDQAPAGHQVRPGGQKDPDWLDGHLSGGVSLVVTGLSKHSW